jgi:hypothetical protein
MLTAQQIDDTGIYGEDDAQSLWTAFLVQQLRNRGAFVARFKSDDDFRQRVFTLGSIKGLEHLVVLRNPFGASVRAIQDIQAVNPPAPATGGTVGGSKRRGQWPSTRTQPEVAKYLSERTPRYNELVPGCLAGEAKAIKEFKELFGPTAIADAIGNGCQKQNVQQTRTYREEIQPLLKRPPRRPKGWTAPEADTSAIDDYTEGALRNVRAKRK